MRFAKVLLERDPNYMTIRRVGWGDILFVPTTDFSLPVYSSQRGKLYFDNEEDKKHFIKNAGASC